jgi:integrase
MARVYFRYSEEVLDGLAAEHGLLRKGLIGALQKREALGQKVVWPRQEAPGNGAWYLDYRDAGKARQQPVTTARTKSEALAKLRDAQNDVEDARAGRRPGRFRPTRFGDAVAQLLEQRKGTKGYTMHELNYRLHIVPSLGRKFLTEITPGDVEALALRLSRGESGKSKLGPSTVNQVITRISMVYTWAKKRKIFWGESPTREAKRLKIPKRLPKRLTSEQVLRLLANSGRWHDLFWFAATTGLREGELCALRWAHLVLDTDAPHIIVSASHDSDTPKDFEERVVPIPDLVVRMLRRRRDESMSQYVWPGADGNMQLFADNVYGDAFKEAATRAGLVQGFRFTCACGNRFFAPTRRPRTCPQCKAKVLPRVVPGQFTFRHLRSTYASALGSAELAQKALGHTELKTTLVHYYHVDAAKLRAAAEVLPFALASGGLAGAGQMRDNTNESHETDVRSAMPGVAVSSTTPAGYAAGRCSRTTPSQYSFP